MKGISPPENSILTTLFLLIFTIISLHVNAQAIVVDDTTYNSEQLAKLLAPNPCTLISNTSISSDKSVAYFHKNNADFPISEGIIIRSGIATHSQGSYTNANLSSQISTNGDPQLQAISDSSGQKSTITDVAYLEFDFVSPTSDFNFDFLFASNEYGEFQCGFSDVFAFLLTDLTSNTTINLAVIPNTNTPISVKDIRDNAYNSSCTSINPDLFDTYNTVGSTTALNMRGYTVVMNASATIIPNRAYKIKLVIGDYNDSDYDSAVFLAAGSFTTTLNLGPDKTICNQTTITTELDTNLYTHTWKKNGVLIPNETDSSIIVNTPGTYEVTAANNQGCILTDQIVISELQVSTPNDLFSCDTGGMTTYDLTLNNEINLGVDTNIYEINYYASLADITNNTPINKSVLSTYQSQGNQTIYLKLKEIATNTLCNLVSSFELKLTAITATKPNDIAICESNNTINLPNAVENQILNGQNATNLSFLYFTSLSDAQNNTNAIVSPNSFTVPLSPNTTSIWARMQSNLNNACYDVVDFLITIIPTASVDQLADVLECSSYVLPPISNGTYYTGTNGTGSILQAGDTISNSGTYYIYNTNVNNCTNESSFRITLIDDYTIALTYCGEFRVDNPYFGAFYTAANGPNGTGSILSNGTALTTSQTIYFYSEINGVLCTDKAFPIVIFPIPEVDQPADVITCNSYTLPSLTNGNYYTGSNASGNLLNAGAVIIASQRIYVYTDNGNCTNQNSFNITIVKDTFDDLTVCDSYSLPALTIGNYYTEPSGGGNLLSEGTILTTSQTIYTYVNTSTSPNCTNNVSFDLTIVPLPDVDQLSDETLCIDDSFTLPTLTNGDYFTQPDRLGTQLFSGDVITSPQTIYINNKGDLCFNETSFILTFRPLPLVDNFTDIFSCDPYVLPVLANGNYYTESGGKGTMLNAGDVISSKQLIYIYNEYSDMNTCSNENFFTVDILGISVDAPDDVLACDSYVLPSLSEGNYYTESRGNGTKLNAGESITTTQKIYVYGENGMRFFCDDENEFTVTISTTPSLPNFMDIKKCDSYTLPDYTLSGSNVGYYRQPNGVDKIDTASYTYSTPGTYTVYVHASAVDNLTCVDEKQFKIFIYPLRDLTISGGVICVDYDTGVTTRSTELSSGLNPLSYTVNWYLNNTLVGTGSTYTATEIGIYTVETIKLTPDVRNECNYKPTQVEVIASSPKATIIFTSAPFVNNNSIRVDFIEEGLGVYELKLDDGAYQTSNKFYNLSPGTHIVTIRDITAICGNLIVKFKMIDYPKFFTPNTDGINDTWNIPDIKQQEDAIIHIYDRYGMLLKKISPASSGWDGIYNGKPVPSTDYWFKVTLLFNDVPTLFRGNFSLIR